jgi:tRNA 2-thiouridine synthesizing protein A
MADAILDAGAENCGRLIGLVVDAIAQLAPGQTRGVKTSDPSTQVDLAAWCRMTGHRLRAITPLADHLELVIEKTHNVKEASHGTRDDPQHARQG